MTREEAKVLLPIIQAYAEGKVVECRTKPSVLSKSWQDMNEWTEMKEIEFCKNIEYRIKPESKYRPFKDTEECWQEMQKHQPFGWIIKNGYYYNIISIGVVSVTIIGTKGTIVILPFSTLLSQYKFVDGALLGIKIKEQLWHGQQLINIIVNIFMIKNLKGVIVVFGHKIVCQIMLQSFQKAVSRNLLEKSCLGMINQQNLKNDMIFYRFDEIPKNEKSCIWRGEEKIGEEKGVSVYEAHKNINGTYSPVLPFPTNEKAFNSFICNVKYFTGNKYLVTGDLLDETGTDGEPLIKNVKILKKLQLWKQKT